MKAKYDRTFEYGKKISKYLIIFALILCVASLVFASQGSYLQMILVIATIGLMIATIVVMYKYCRCPYCGKHIMMGILAVTNCPRCRRSLTTGKKVKK